MTNEEQEARERFIKKKLAEVPGPYRTFATMRQTRTAADFEYNTLLYDGFDNNGGWTAWRFRDAAAR